MAKNVDVPDGCTNKNQKSVSQNALDVLHRSLSRKLTKSISEQVYLLSNRIKINDSLLMKHKTIAIKNAKNNISTLTGSIFIEAHWCQTSGLGCTC